MDGVKLVVLTGLKAVRRPNGRLLLTQKFIDGVSLYKELWKGPLTLLCEADETPSVNLDNVEIDVSKMPFDVMCGSGIDHTLDSCLSSKSVVLSPVGMQFNNVSAIAGRHDALAIYISEYTLETRLQIIREYKRNPLKVWWSSRWEKNQELMQIRSIAISSGVQCNGTPTFYAYKDLTRNPLLFFDTRMTSEIMSSGGVIDRKYSTLPDRPFHLAFTGRLTKMKGVDDIPSVALELKRLGIPFIFSICGDGDYADEMKRVVVRDETYKSDTIQRESRLRERASSIYFSEG